MIRITKLLRSVKIPSKIPARAGPGWDRPDVPPSQTVQTNRRWTHDEIIFTFFDSSMPEYYITEPEVYEGNLYQALPSLLSFWGVFCGTAFAFYAFCQLVNPLRKHRVIEPVYTEYVFNQYKKIYEQKIGLKWARENPVGINVQSELYPYDDSGSVYIPPIYTNLKAAYDHTKLIQNQSREYLKRALERASAPQTVASHDSHHH